MSSIRLKTKQDIKDFFKILAEESVKSAKKQVLDTGASYLNSQSKLDKKAYSDIREEEEEEVVEDDLDVSAATPEEPVAAEEDIDTSVAVETQDIEDVSLDSIAKKIKIMRSGLSVDDSSVQQPLRTYFDLLSDAERKALYAFLNAIAGMMTGETTAENADDPSDPPYNVTMSSGEIETEDEESIETEDFLDDTSDIDVEVEEEEEVESDGSVPIRVGGVQSRKSISEIRKKVISLLGKS